MLDKFSAKLISACYKMADLMHGFNIYSIESLAVKRKPTPRMEAIYLLTPSEESVRLLLQDWQPPAKYRFPDIFFSLLRAFVLRFFPGIYSTEIITCGSVWCVL